MPKSSSDKKTKTTRTKKSKRRTDKTTVVSEESKPQAPEPTPAPAPVVESPPDSSVSTKTKRRVPTRDTVLEEFDNMVSLLEAEISKLRETAGKAKGVKFLRSLGKRLKLLKNSSGRVMKKRTTRVRKNNSNSGFLKPVQISKEMAKFTGWNHEELRSRVDVTKFICNYIKEKDLQNPVDRRQILADNKLSKLLDYDSKTDGNPLTYYRIQTFIKPHFVKDTPAVK